MAGRKLAAFALVISVVGLPINDLFDYAVLVLVAVLVATGTVAADPRRWGAAALVAVLAIAGHTLLPAPRIEEGHNIFLGLSPGAGSDSDLPADVSAVMVAELAAQYPARDCSRPLQDCPAPDTPTFGFSADGIYTHPAYSRQVSGIDFSDPVTLRIGASNELTYNWGDGTTDIRRSERDRRSWKIFGRVHLLLPLFVMYRFPKALVGSALCWSGDVLWEGSDQSFALTRHQEMACRPLAVEDVGRRIFGISIDRNAPLAMTLEPTLAVRLRGAFEAAFTLLGAAGIVMLLVQCRPRRTLLPLLLIGCALVNVMFEDPLFIGGFRPLDGTDDGLMYEGLGRVILRNLLDGHWPAALMGGEAVYYFTPGMRYFRALEQFIFGDTFLGYLSVILTLPFLVLAAFRRFLPIKWALGFVLIFTAIPLGALFGSTFVLYAKAASRGYADPLAFASFLAGFVLIVPRPGERGGVRAASRFWGALLLAIAVYVRPNLVLAAAVMGAAAFLSALRHGRLASVGALAVGFLPILLPALHNWVFGHALVPFGANAVVAMRTTPVVYGEALLELSRLNISGGHVVVVASQISEYLSGPLGLIVMLPVHLVAIGILIRVALAGSRFDPWLRVTALAVLLEHGIGLFYLIYERYYLLTWLMTLLVDLAWLNVEGLALARRRVPVLYDRLCVLFRVRRLEQAIERLRVVLSLDDGRYRGGLASQLAIAA